MKIVLQTARTCNDGPAQQFGDVIDVTDIEEARRMIAAGQARPYRIEPETATTGARENAAMPGGRKR